MTKLLELFVWDKTFPPNQCDSIKGQNFIGRDCLRSTANPNIYTDLSLLGTPRPSMIFARGREREAVFSKLKLSLSRQPKRSISSQGCGGAEQEWSDRNVCCVAHIPSRHLLARVLEKPAPCVHTAVKCILWDSLKLPASFLAGPFATLEIQICQSNCKREVIWVQRLCSGQLD